MIAKVAGKLLDVTETGAFKAADTCLKLGAWVVPFCYRRECARIIRQEHDELEARIEEEGIVKSIGTMALRAHCGKLPIDMEEVQNIARIVGPSLERATYQDVFNPHESTLLEHVAPLHDANE